MIPVTNLLFNFDTKANRLSNLRGQFIPVETKIVLINRAQIKLVLRKIGSNNLYQLGLDASTKRYEDLQNLQVTDEQLNLVVIPDDVLNGYNVPYSALSHKLLIPISGYVLADRGNCKNRILDVIDFMKHADRRMLLKSPHYKPNFNYQETLADISGNEITVYSDPENSFKPKTLYLSYLRYPVEVDYAGYTHLNGTPSTTVDCELEDYLMDELLDIAISEYADATANQELSQTSRVRAKENE